MLWLEPNGEVHCKFFLLCKCNEGRDFFKMDGKWVGQ